MAIKKYSMFRGDDRQINATITDTYSAAAKVNFTVKPKTSLVLVDATDTTAIFNVTATSTNATVNAPAGTVTYAIIIPSASTTGKTPGNYIGEVEYVSGTGKHTTYEQFEFELKGDANQRP